MKKIALLIAMVTFGFVVNAQEIKFGPKVGLNLSNLRSSENIDAGTRTSFHIGGMAEVRFGEKLAIQPELLYSEQGTSKKISSTGAGIVSASYKNVLSYNYLTIPVMAKYFIIDDLAVELGPQVGFLLSAKSKKVVSAGGVSVSTDSNNEMDFKEFTNSVDFGLNVGASYTFIFGLNAGVRYSLGLSKTNKIGPENIKNGVFQVSVGYFF